MGALSKRAAATGALIQPSALKAIVWPRQSQRMLRALMGQEGGGKAKVEGDTKRDSQKQQSPHKAGFVEVLGGYTGT
ncbi:hypothetical protein C1888_13740 [Pseudomonas sp. GW531-T4]|nr:hypothetical protein C1888_13740 [Pseudomonas sp. GW531-T4]